VTAEGPPGAQYTGKGVPDCGGLPCWFAEEPAAKKTRKEKRLEWELLNDSKVGSHHSNALFVGRLPALPRTSPDATVVKLYCSSFTCGLHATYAIKSSRLSQHVHQ
jgi:hypothetical protein